MSDAPSYSSEVLARVRSELDRIAESSETIDHLLEGELPQQEQHKIDLIRRTLERLERELTGIVNRLGEKESQEGEGRTSPGG